MSKDLENDVVVLQSLILNRIKFLKSFLNCDRESKLMSGVLLTVLMFISL